MPHARRLAIAILAAITSAANAQRLNLGGGPREPGPGDGLAALALADDLEAEARAVSGRPARALRRLAAALLRAGEAAGAEGSEAVIAGLTLTACRDDLDPLFAASPDAAAQFAEIAASAAVSTSARDIDLLLRDALAPLATDADETCGWWNEPDGTPDLDALGARLRAIAGQRRVSEEAEAALGEVADLVTLGADRPAYRRSAADWAELILGAADVLEEPPPWLEMPARDRLRAEFSAGAALCLADPESARASLGRTRTIARIVRTTDDLEPPAQSRELREAVNRLAMSSPADPTRDGAAVQRTSEAFFLALDLIDADRDMPQPSELVRQTRPMVNPLLDAHRAAKTSVANLLPDLLDATDPMTLPGVIAARNSITRTSSDLRMPAQLSELLRAWPMQPDRPGNPSVQRATAPLAERIRQLGVSLADEDEADEALASLRTLATRARHLLGFAGERELRAGAGERPWQRVTGGEADQLLRLIDRARDDWLRSSGIEMLAMQGGEHDRRVRAIAAVLPVLRDAVVIEQMLMEWTRQREPACNAHPGWEISPATARVLSEGLLRNASDLAATLLAGDDAGAIDRAARLTESYAGALLLARLETDLRERGLSRCDPVAELALGPPRRDSPSDDHRETMAKICRYAFEASHAAGERQTELLALVNRAAAPLLEP